MEEFKVTFYDENENVLQEIDRMHTDLDKLFYEIIDEFGCDDSIEYRRKNGHLYGYISTFDCYGRFYIDHIENYN